MKRILLLLPAHHRQMSLAPSHIMHVRENDAT